MNKIYGNSKIEFDGEHENGVEFFSPLRWLQTPHVLPPVHQVSHMCSL